MIERRPADCLYSRHPQKKSATRVADFLNSGF